jgi:phytol kinase
VTGQPFIALIGLLLAAGSLLAAMWLTRLIAPRYGLSPEIQRKMVHVATGLFAIALPWILPEPWLVYSMLALSIVVMATLRLPALARDGIGSALHGVERKSWGDFMLVAAVGTLYFLSGNASNPVLYNLPLAVLTLSDAAAALAGSTYGRIHYIIEDGQKSIEGSVIFFLVTWILAMVAILLMSDVSRPNVALLSLLTAAFATTVEADSWRGFDNYFVPIGVFFIVDVHMYSEPWVLCLLAVGFLSVLNLLRVYGGALVGLSDHTARAYTAALFMIGAATTLPNLVLPALVLGVQTWTRRVNPCQARHPDLDNLAMLAVVSFVALIGGMALGRSGISFYTTICGAIVAQFVVIAFSRCSREIRLGSAVVSSVATVLVIKTVIALNPPELNWHGPILPLVAISLIVPTLISALRPDFYARERHLKVGSIAAVIPVLGYVFYYVRTGAA